MPRRIVTTLIALIALLAFASPALAKEGAVTKFDSGLPSEWHAGQSYTLGYTIRMDGVEPYQADKTEIVANSIDGKTSLVFPGVADGAPGHYTAKVTFPAVGTYRWKVTQGSYFAPFELGTISVLPALPLANSSTPASAPMDPVRDAIPFAAAGATVFATYVLARQRRRTLRTA